MLKDLLEEIYLGERKNRVRAQLRATAILALFAALAVFSACSSGQGGADVLAKVNNHKIMRAELDKYYRTQTEGSPQPLAEEQAQTLRLNILRQLVDNELLVQRADKLGLLATDEEVENRLNQMKSPYTKEEFDRRLKEQNLTLDDLRRESRRTISIEKLMNKEISSKVNISDADVSAFYNQHKAELNLIEPQYHLAQILVTSKPDPRVRNQKNDKAQNDAEARKKVEMIENRLKSGEDFATLASSYSEHSATAANGGDLGFIPESELKSDRAAFEIISRLKPGEHTQPVAAVDPRTREIHYMVFRLIEKLPAGQRELSDQRVQQAIRGQLRERREQLLRTAYFESLRNGAKIENYFAEQILKSTGGQ